MLRKTNSTKEANDVNESKQTTQIDQTMQTCILNTLSFLLIHILIHVTILTFLYKKGRIFALIMPQNHVTKPVVIPKGGYASTKVNINTSRPRQLSAFHEQFQKHFILRLALLAQDYILYNQH